MAFVQLLTFLVKIIKQSLLFNALSVTAVYTTGKTHGALSGFFRSLIFDPLGHRSREGLPK